MKRSNKVVLSAIFLSAVASVSARAQEAPLPAADSNKVKDSTIVNNDSTMVSYNDSAASYEPGQVYNEPPPPTYSFFRFHWVFHWNNYWHHRRHHSGERNVVIGPRTHLPNHTSAPHNPVQVTGPRTNGFGNSMRTSHATAHS